MLHCIPPGILSFTTGYVIEGSAVTDLGDLIRTPDADGNLRTNVIEIIFKGSTLITGSEIVLFQAYNGSSGSSTAIQSNTSNQIRCDFGTGGIIVSDPVLRDPAAWYHLIFAIDTTQATNTNRGRLFLNGTQLPLASATWPNQNTDGQLNDQVAHAFMSIYDGRDAAHFDGYMARAAIYDGLSVGVGGSTDLTPFGEVTDDGFWQINDVSDLTFGGQGVLMEGGAALAAGTDSSGNGNDFTKAGTITATNDGPMNRGDFGNYSTMSPLATHASILSQGNLNVITAGGNFSNSVGSLGVSSGKWYFEYTQTTTGSPMIGVTARPDLFKTDYYHNNGREGYLYYSLSGIKALNGTQSAYGASWGNGDVIGVAIDYDADTLIFYKNNSSQGTALSGLPATLYACHDSNSTNDHGGTFNFGATAFAYTPPAGHLAIATQNLPTPAVVNYEDEYFISETPYSPAIDDNTAGDSANNNEYDFIGNSGNGTSRTASTSDGGYIQIAGNGIPNTNGHYAGKNFGVIGDTATVTVTLWYTGNMAFRSSNQAIMRFRIETTNYEHKLDYGSDVVELDGTALQVSGSNYTFPTQTKNLVSFECFVDSTTLISTCRMSVGGTVIGTGGNTTPIANPRTAARFFPATGGSENARAGGDGDLAFGIHAYGNNPATSHRLYDIAITSTGSAITLPKTVSGGAMVRVKRTDAAGDWIIFDTIRGVNKALVYNEDDVQDTSTYDDQNLTGTTFTMPTALPGGYYLVECFYVGDFFQITAYTGNDTNRNIAFASALDTAPGMMYIKNLNTASRNGIIYHQSTGNTHYLRANTALVATDSNTRFNDTSPTTTQFTVGTENVVNQDGKLMICYAWANSGPYAFGSYTGNGNVDGPVVNVGVGGRPQFLFRRNSGAATFYSTTSPQLNSNEVNSALNLSSTQALTADAVSQMDFLSTGFKTRDNGSEVHLNSSGATYIYGAFGIQPLTDGSINQGRAK